MLFSQFRHTFQICTNSLIFVAMLVECSQLEVLYSQTIALLILWCFAFMLLLSPFFTDTSNILTRIGLGDVNIPAPSPTSTAFPNVGSPIDHQDRQGYRKFEINHFLCY